MTVNLDVSRSITLQQIQETIKNAPKFPTRLNVPAYEKLSAIFRDYEQNEIDPLSVIQLVYLATKSSPFTKKDEEVFKTAKDRIEQSSKWLKAGLIGTTLLTVTPFVGAVPRVSAWATANPSNNLNLVIAFIAVAALVNVINFFATGTLPDRQTSSATQAVLRQETISRRFENLTCELKIMARLQLPEAREIAQILDIEKIRSNMITQLPSEDHKVMANKWCGLVENAKCIVLDTPLSYNTSAKTRYEKMMNLDLPYKIT